MDHENLDEMSKDDLILRSNRPSTSKVDSELSILNALSSVQGMTMDISKIGLGQLWLKPIRSRNIILI